jgi:predicted NUDIX family phosphoesterase
MYKLLYEVVLTKSELQIRAEGLANRFAFNSRKPVVIEFAGVPKAGKTTTISQIYAFLKRCGFRVEVVVERASICPIRDKKHSNFNVWTACTTLAQILERTQDPPRHDDPQILILDRGLFDSICWLTMMERLARIRPAERQCIENFLTVDDWRKRITAVLVMTTSPEDSMEREKGYLPVETTGSIMNPQVLAQMLAATRENAVRLKRLFRIFEIDTSTGKNKTGSAQKTAEEVAGIVLDLIEEQLEEEILFIQKEEVRSVFKKKSSLRAEDARTLLEIFQKSGSFKPREVVEADSSKVQALPVVVVRNRSGEILRLRRREKSDSNPLHEKLVIWAGGHVRKEDAHNGDPLKQCALREIQEELRLSLKTEDLEFLGATYADSGGKTSQHVALVFEWRAPTDEVAIALSSAEFFERRGTSLSGQFVGLEELAEEVRVAKLSETWSVEILRELLPQSQSLFEPRLF